MRSTNAVDIVKAVTVIAGSITAAALAFQIAVNASLNIEYWEVGDASSGRSIWFGVIAVGLILAGSILVQRQALIASIVFALSTPLVVLYENDHNSNFLSISVSKTLGNWMWVAALLLVALAQLCWRLDRSEVDTAG